MPRAVVISQAAYTGTVIADSIIKTRSLQAREASARGYTLPASYALGMLSPSLRARPRLRSRHANLSDTCSSPSSLSLQAVQQDCLARHQAYLFAGVVCGARVWVSCAGCLRLLRPTMARSAATSTTSDKLLAGLLLKTRPLLLCRQQTYLSLMLMLTTTEGRYMQDHSRAWC